MNDLALTRAEARSLTDQVKEDAQALWTKLLALYEGGAHTALGYSSWATYYEAEFGKSGNYGYRLLRSARILDQLPNGNHPASEGVARELAPLRDQPQALRDAWVEAVERHGPQPTAEEVREVVRGPESPRRNDMRFAAIDDAVALLKLLPVVDDIVWPTDEGDVQVVADALSWLAGWAPRANAAFKRHRRAAVASSDVRCPRGAA